MVQGILTKRIIGESTDKLYYKLTILLYYKPKSFVYTVITNTVHTTDQTCEFIHCTIFRHKIIPCNKHREKHRHPAYTESQVCIHMNAGKPLSYQ